jgi:hypothetical protein
MTFETGTFSIEKIICIIIGLLVACWLIIALLILGFRKRHLRNRETFIIVVNEPALSPRLMLLCPTKSQQKQLQDQRLCRPEVFISPMASPGMSSFYHPMWQDSRLQRPYPACSRAKYQRDIERGRKPGYRFGVQRNLGRKPWMDAQGFSTMRRNQLIADRAEEPGDMDEIRPVT